MSEDVIKPGSTHTAKSFDAMTPTPKECTCIEAAGFIHKCPLHKERPLRPERMTKRISDELTPLMKLARERGETFALQNAAHKIADLTEALERDEKRRAALEEIADWANTVEVCMSADGSCPATHMNALRRSLDRLDALTPTQEEA